MRAYDLRCVENSWSDNPNNKKLGKRKDQTAKGGFFMPATLPRRPESPRQVLARIQDKGGRYPVARGRLHPRTGNPGYPVRVPDSGDKTMGNPKTDCNRKITVHFDC